MTHLNRHRKASVKMIKEFFSAVVDENCARACRSEPPLLHDDCVSRWNTVSQALGVEAFAKPESEDLEEDGFSRSRSERSRSNTNQKRHRKRDRRTESYPAARGKRRDRDNGPPAKKPNGNLPFCGLFNKAHGCTNKQVNY